jgi:hypothetical protein
MDQCKLRMQLGTTTHDIKFLAEGARQMTMRREERVTVHRHPLFSTWPKKEAS